MNNMFESKKFSLILGGLLLLLLGISGFVLLSDSDKSLEEVATVTDKLKEDVKDNSPFIEEKPLEDPNYEEEISKQYEEYQKLQEEKKKDSPKKPTTTSPSKGNETNGSVGGTIGGGSGGNKGGGNSGGGSGNGSGGNSGGNGGSDKDKDKGGGVVLPPINVGNPNPTVPKLPDKPKPPVTNPTKPPVTKPTNPPGNGNNPPDDGNNPPDEGNNPPDDGNNPPDEGNNPPDEGNNPPDEGNNPPDEGPKPPAGDYGSIIPVERPDPIDTAPHPEPTENQSSGKNGLSMISTNYGNGFRILPIDFKVTSVGAQARFEFHNSSSKPMTITDDHIGFVYDKGYNDFADSQLGESPMVIQPKQTVVLNLTTSYPEARSVFFQFNGTDSSFEFGNSEGKMKDAKPLTSDDIDVKEGGYVESLAVGHIAGNENLKIEPLGVVLASNNEIGPLKKSTKGALGLVKVRVANTSKKEITVQELLAGSWDFETDTTNVVTFPLKDLSLLGGNALATKIPPNQIIEGYLPFYLKDTNHVSMVYVKTSDVDFQLTAIESYGRLFE